MSPASTRNYNIDLVKSLACLMVIGLHSFHGTRAFLSRTAYLLCGFSIPAFFMSTGWFVLQKDRGDSSYCLKKARALVRLGLLWIVPEFFLVLLVRLAKGADLSSYGLLSLPRAIAVSFLNHGSLWDCVWHMWYLAASALVFLLLIPLFGTWLNRTDGRSGARFRMLLRIWIPLALAGVLLQLVSYLIGEPLAASFCETLRVWTWLQYFLLGGLMPRVCRIVKRKVPFLLHLPAALLLAGAVLVQQNLLIHRMGFADAAEYFYDDPLMAAYVVCLFALLMRIPLGAGMERALSFFSPLTLGIYLIHPFIRKVYLISHSLSGARSQCLCFAVLLLGSSILAFVLSKIPYLKKLVSL